MSFSNLSPSVLGWNYLRDHRGPLRCAKQDSGLQRCTLTQGHNLVEAVLMFTILAKSSFDETDNTNLFEGT